MACCEIRLTLYKSHFFYILSFLNKNYSDLMAFICNHFLWNIKAVCLNFKKNLKKDTISFYIITYIYIICVCDKYFFFTLLLIISNDSALFLLSNWVVLFGF